MLQCWAAVGSLSVVGSSEREGEVEARWECGCWPLMRRRPIPGLRHAIFPSCPGWRLAEPEPAILRPASSWQVRPRKLHMWTSRGFPGASLPPDPPCIYPFTFAGFVITRVAPKWTSIGHTHLILKTKLVSDDGSESWGGDGEPCLTSFHFSAFPSEGLPLSIRQGDGSGDQIVNAPLTRLS